MVNLSAMGCNGSPFAASCLLPMLAERMMLGTILLLIYAICIAVYCSMAMASKGDEELSRLDLIFAVTLPLGCCGGILVYLFAGDNRIWACLYLPIYLLAVAGFVWEFADFRKLKGNVLLNLVGMFLAVSAVFGFGLVHGTIWLVQVLW